MKKTVLIIAALFTIGTATTQVVLKNKQYKNKNKDRFSVKENVVYYDGKAPWAKRVDGVKGIFAAHKAAAKLAATDMFYVVDGDAYLLDDWEFDYQPKIFDRDCAYVWASVNPVNELTYGHGGVKLFSRDALIKKKKWDTIDMTLGIMSKIKFMDKVSNLNAFNTDAYSTWRTAFRECVKLSKINNVTKLDAWCTVGEDKRFGKYAIGGARAAIAFFNKNKTDPDKLQRINDYNWLEKQFEKFQNGL